MRLQGSKTGAGSLFFELGPAKARLVGSYQRYSVGGGFLGRGVVEFERHQPNDSLKGTWAAAYFDTHGDRASVTKVVDIDIVAVDESTGAHSGLGVITAADSGREISFAVRGEVLGDVIRWTWEGGQIIGATTWNLHHAGDVLYGTYTDGNSEGGKEVRGSAVWHRMSHATN